MTKDNKNKQIMTEEELNKLAVKIVSRMMNIQTMADWFIPHHLRNHLHIFLIYV